MKDASYTVEAVFVISVCIWVLLALLYGSFFIHDRAILGSVTNELTAEEFLRADTAVTEGWQQNVREKLEKKLFLMRINKVEAKKGVASVKIQVRYRLPVSIRNIKALFSESEGEELFVTTKELTRPVEYKWDYRLLKEK